MVDLQPTPFTTASTVIASYSITEILSGINYLTLYLGNSKDSTGENFNLSSVPFMPSSTDGLIDIGIYQFKSQKTNEGKIARGTAFISGVTDATATSFVITSQLFKKTGEVVAEGIGSIDWTSDAEVTSSDSSYALRKTINIDGYVNKVTMEMKIQDAGGVPSTSSYAKYYYTDGTQENGATMTTSSAAYVEKESNNPSQEKNVSKIEIWSKGYGGTGTWVIKLVKVYAENVSNTPVAMTAEITSNTMGAATAFLIELPVTNPTSLSPEDNLLLNLTTTGTGKIVIDPNQTFNTDETTKLFLAFDT